MRSFAKIKHPRKVVIFIFSSAEGLTVAGFKNDDVRFVVFRNGKVRWIYPLHLTTTCEVLVSRFPFDSQSCYLEMAFRLSNGINMIADVHKEVMCF